MSKQGIINLLEAFNIKKDEDNVSKQSSRPPSGKISEIQIYRLLKLPLEELSTEELFELSCHILKKPFAERIDKDLSILLKSTSSVRFFQDLENEELKNSPDSPPAIHQECCTRLGYKFCSKGEVVFYKGSIGRTFYIILQGSVGITVDVQEPSDSPDKEPILVQREVKILDSGSAFGELALLSLKPRAATITAKEDTHLACLDKEDFVRILKSREEQKLMQQLNFLANLKFFSHWNYSLLQKLFLETDVKIYKRGDIIYSEGQNSDTVYIIKSGELKKFKQIQFDSEKPIEHIKKHMALHRQGTKNGIRTIELALLGKGEIFGEYEVSISLPRKSSVQCVSETAEVFCISHKAFVTRVLCEDTTRQYLKENTEYKEGVYTLRIKQNINTTLENRDLLFRTPRNLLEPKPQANPPPEEMIGRFLSPLAKVESRSVGINSIYSKQWEGNLEDQLLFTDVATLINDKLPFVSKTIDKGLLEEALAAPTKYPLFKKFTKIKQYGTSLAIEQESPLRRAIESENLTRKSKASSSQCDSLLEQTIPQERPTSPSKSSPRHFRANTTTLRILKSPSLVQAFKNSQSSPNKTHNVDKYMIPSQEIKMTDENLDESFRRNSLGSSRFFFPASVRGPSNKKLLPIGNERPAAKSGLSISGYKDINSARQSFSPKPESRSIFVGSSAQWLEKTANQTLRKQSSSINTFRDREKIRRDGYEMMISMGKKNAALQSESMSGTYSSIDNIESSVFVTNPKPLRHLPVYLKPSATDSKGNSYRRNERQSLQLFNTPISSLQSTSELGSVRKSHAIHSSNSPTKYSSARMHKEWTLDSNSLTLALLTCKKGAGPKVLKDRGTA